MDIIDTEARTTFLDSHPDWRIDDEVLSRQFEFASFAAAIGFVAAVGVIAEKAFHHPDIDIRYTTVTVSLTTHDAGGLTENDTTMAENISDLR